MKSNLPAILETELLAPATRSEAPSAPSYPVNPTNLPLGVRVRLPSFTDEAIVQIPDALEVGIENSDAGFWLPPVFTICWSCMVFPLAENVSVPT